MNEKTFKITFKLSSSFDTKISRYAKYHNLSKQTVIRFLLIEQLLRYKLNPDSFNSDYNKCIHRDSEGTFDDYGKKKFPKKYSLEVSEYIHDNVNKLKKSYGDKSNTVINNLLHIGINKKFADFDNNFSTEFKNIIPNTKQYSIPLSYVFKDSLEKIAQISGIKVNKLMSLIIGNYLIEHFTDYDDNIYQTLSGKLHHSVF